MKRQQIVLISIGVVFLLLCLGVGFFLFSSISEKDEAKESFESELDKMERIVNAKVFPSVTNAVQVNRDEKAVAAWLERVSGLFRQGEIASPVQTPSGFKQNLQSTVTRLASHPGQNQGKVAAPNFYFGFDKYLGGSSELPPDTNVATRLSYRLAVIEKVCNELYEAGILEIKGITRELFDTAVKNEEEEETRESRRNNRRNRRNRDSAESDRAVQTEGLPAFVKKQSFGFEFIARPDSLFKALNRITRMTPYTTLSKVEFSASSDSLASYQQGLNEIDERRKTETQAADSENPLAAQKPPAEERRIIVTSPDLEPPLTVKLSVDVYTFEGV
ncbi:MAG: Amuc_1100 family pilus-like protein [Kiritimatiellae bacterium]|nr:Amuc_1100 family pilus-like protein [Kiritimatiellia bacterium]